LVGREPIGFLLLLIEFRRFAIWFQIGLSLAATQDVTDLVEKSEPELIVAPVPEA
jgi:hypothetical protein